MQNSSVAWLNTTKVKIGLSPTKSKPHYKLSRSPKKSKAVLNIQKQIVSAQTAMQEVAHPHTSSQKRSPQAHNNKEMILHEYPDVFDGIGTFPGPSYHIQIDPRIPLSKQLADQSLYT